MRSELSSNTYNRCRVRTSNTGLLVSTSTVEQALMAITGLISTRSVDSRSLNLAKTKLNGVALSTMTGKSSMMNLSWAMV